MAFTAWPARPSLSTRAGDAALKEQQPPVLPEDARGARHDGLTSGYLYAQLGGRTRALVYFTLCYFAAACLGYHFKVDLAIPALMWPAAGVLFSALWMTDTRDWPVLLAAQVVADLAATFTFLHPPSVGTSLLYSVSNGVGGVVGVMLARRHVSRRPEARTARSLQMLWVTAVGSLASCLPGVWGNWRAFPEGPSFITQLEVWAAGNWVGLAAVVPVLNSWLSPMRLRHRELALRSVPELIGLVLLMAAVTAFVFGQHGPRPTLLLQVPFSLVAVMLLAAFRLPPRWAAMLAMCTAMACVELTNLGLGPFGAMEVLRRHALLQGFLASLVVTSYGMSVALAEVRLSLGRLADSEARYRSLVELSTEAIWRVELEVPMPVALAPADQVQWLRRHASVAESNRAFRMVDPNSSAPGNGHWQHQIPWSGVYERNIAEIIRNQYTMGGLRFTVEEAGRTHTFLVAFSGVVVDERLLRIWGVAREVTEMEQLNARLRQEQDRLRTYARELANAEERARRATAVDLHDGIGQSLVGMAMTLNAVRGRVSPDVKTLIDEVQARLRAVQEHTREMISDLSPPGLYDLGLGPALQWLTLYTRSHDRLNVQLTLQVDEERVSLEMRVLVFKLVRELLRNVARHAGVDEATLAVHGDAQLLRVEVADRGRGFEWRRERSGDSFGLWSIAVRVQEAGGRFSVDAAPGAGSRLVMEFPLGADGAGTAADVAAAH